MPNIVLHYFDVKALGESIRLLLTYGGLEFVDHRVDEKDWESVKPSMPFGQMPVLEIDGKQYAQSVAIARYLGKKFKINGENIEEEFEIDQNVDYLNSIRDEAAVVHYDIEEKDRERKYNEMKEKFLLMIKKLDEIIRQNNGHIAAGKLTWGDFVFAGSFDYLKMLLRMPDLEKQYPSFRQVIDAVHEDFRVKDYSMRSPKTEY
ncbi:unnamed protein product [Euphydryas editha]|uniref:glutathione transferase n=1 Tax=Euphydryas editha TaxID=104508 RepID=A0AAU9U011_EUPED|nr:unnamed protein product [Euphydryas editha]